MILEKGQHVKCLMRCNMAIEGFVESWTDAEVVLRSLDDKNLTIIHRPADDIIFTQIILDAAPQVAEPIVENASPKEEIKKKLQEVRDIEDPELRNKSVEELRKMVIAQDREILARKRKEHFGTSSSPKMTRYAPQSAYLPKGLPKTGGTENKFPYKPGKIPFNKI